jgi:hypothetical protein
MHVLSRPIAWCGLLMLLLAACPDEDNFSQHPGFAEWYAANPPAHALPDPQQRALLECHQPRVFLPLRHEGPIDFYRDYVAQGRLYDGRGELISAHVTPGQLNAHRGDPQVVFVHEPSGAPPQPVMYGRIDRAELALPGCSAPLPVTFLTYHLVFRHSGLPAGLPWWQEAALGAVADLADWHQLDHYTALSLALAPVEEGALAPFAATFQHHNYLRTYLLADREGAGRLAVPPDGRLAVDVATRSNELYPHRAEPTRHRAVPFMDADGARYLVSGGRPPWRAADDVTAPAHAVEPTLAFLPPSDAFYVFQGWLGERRALPGRDGPPGADYNTLPALKPKALQLVAFYWYEDDRNYLDLLAAALEGGRPQTVDPEPFAARLARDLAAPFRRIAGCQPRRAAAQIARVSPIRITQASSSP